MSSWGDLFNRFILRDLQKNWLRTGLTVLGIALGVAILLAISLANHTALFHFKDSVTRVAGKANLEIRDPVLDRFDETQLNKLHWLWDEHAQFTPVIQQTAILPADEKQNLPQEVIEVIGVDMLNDVGFRDYQWADQQDGNPESFLDIFEQGQIFVSSDFAKKRNLILGDAFNLYINDVKQPLTVAGILSKKGLGGAFGGSLMVMDIAAFQDAFAMAGTISRVEMIIPKEKLDTVQDTLQNELPQNLTVQRPKRRGEQVEKMLAAYQYNLTVLSFIALLVGMFLIYNTMSITVIRRRPEIGTMRAIGVTRQSILSLFTAEALVLGIIGTLLGMGLGIILATGAVKAVSTTVQTLYTGQPVSGLNISAFELIKAVVFGIGVTLLGAIIPVLEAASVQPAQASRHASYETKIQRISSALAWLGVFLLLVALGSSFIPPIQNVPIFGFVSALTTILGAAFLVPVCLQASFHWIGLLLKPLLKEEGRLAVLDLKGAIGRTSVAVASLMIGIAMMVSLAVMIGSFRQTVITWVNQSLTADIWIEPASRGSGPMTGRLTPELVQTIRNTPGVEAADVFLEFPFEYNGQPSNMGVGDFDIFVKYGYLDFLDGEDSSAVIQRVLNLAPTQQPGVIVTEPFANKHNMGKGDTITITTPTGPLTMSIEGVYYNYVSEQGYVVMPRQVYTRHFNDDAMTGVALYLTPNTNAQDVRTAIYDRLEGNTSLTIQTNQELRNQVIHIFENTFAITYALHVIAIIVALLAVMNSLFAIVLESRRNFGILKYIGASQQQITKMILVEAGLLGFFGNLMGLFVGFLLSFLLIFVINKQSFGWTIQFALPAEFLIQSFLLVMITAILSGWWPARMASKTVAPEVVRSE